MPTTNQLHDSHVDHLIYHDYVTYLDLPFYDDEDDEAFVKHCEQQHNGVQ